LEVGVVVFGGIETIESEGYFLSLKNGAFVLIGLNGDFFIDQFGAIWLNEGIARITPDGQTSHWV
jgi:hypothetical protein